MYLRVYLYGKERTSRGKEVSSNETHTFVIGSSDDVQEQDPPGLTPGSGPVGHDQSHAETAQPVQVANPNAFKPE